ncbi:hypothetical protein PFICI_08166 [Pestalotiopsis fici W106-1]|uniref:Heterokaryon incompatibility domain-containing protein n=1 Tax=Pestalotiopsis fici (strain W106-1 / CGMCC3.15140) TaxID=1229662 RepID=W3X5E5_PESFW|nr:uncharacterized protein PFICI_08166 [Pestalotiopsis fici W106-1]ETS80637.1 hypothetical protein PFICI_08166 [Pestalotiopsis fici W106-1]
MSGLSTNLFEYEQLPQGRFIRLLHLYPGNPGTPLIAKLEIVSLDQDPSYQALSYVWGSSTLDCSLGITTESQGIKTVHITTSLSNALNDLRQPPENNQHPRILWIDAVCINQKDINEKNTQIPLMRSIYQEAETVVAYLCSDPTGILGANLCLSIDQIKQKPKPDLVAIIESFAKPAQWLERSWVVQESILARHLVFMMRIDHAFAVNTWRFRIDVRKDSLLRFHDYAQQQRVMARSLVNSSRHDTAFWSLVVLLRILRVTNCQNPLDKVFALLADYNQSVTEVYTDVAHRIITIPGGVYMLCNAYRRQHPILASYVPDWSVTDVLYPLAKSMNRMPRKLSPINIPRQYRNGILLRCLSFGRLKKVKAFPKLPTVSIFEELNDQLEPVSQFVRDFVEHCVPFHPDEGGRSVKRALGRSLISMAMGKATDKAWEDYSGWMVYNSPPKEQIRASIKKVSRVIQYAQELCRRSQEPWASKMLVSDSGFIGNGCEGAEVGDRIIIPFGMSVPLLVRPVAKDAARKGPQDAAMAGKKVFAI